MLTDWEICLIANMAEALELEEEGVNKINKNMTEERPRKSYIETVYHRGEEPTWEVGDTLAYYEFYSDYEGESVLGKVVKIELDEDFDDWCYYFDSGSFELERDLITEEAYVKTNKK